MFEKKAEGFFVLSQKELDKLNEQSEIEILREQLTQANADLMSLKLEQAKANAEMIELMMSMLGGV